MSMESVSNHVSTTAAYATASAKQTTKAAEKNGTAAKADSQLVEQTTLINGDFP